MIVIRVKENDMEKVFEILSANGRFAELTGNRFRVDEHVDEIMKKIKDVGIEVEIIDGDK